MALRTTGITVTQAAERLRVTVGRVRQLLASGALTGEKMGPRFWLVDAESVARYAAGDRRPGRRPVQNS